LQSAMPVSLQWSIFRFTRSRFYWAFGWGSKNLRLHLLLPQVVLEAA
jgi:hypothetical protein